ncbi:MAG: DUF192 domain-containing protein [Oligoflexia bacterium]|nr:DUF192 domain-containing protein [Oligoflexia bacterium]
MKALNSKNQSILSARLEVANSLYERMKGLMGRKNFSEGQALLIKRSGNSIHTFFMNFPIDLVFIDKRGQVRWVKENVKPWRVVFAPIFVQTDCLELPSGMINKTHTQVGDHIHVEA